jgi:hypothetical protein
MNLILLKSKHLVYNMAALLTILRLWRITEVINGKTNDEDGASK